MRLAGTTLPAGAGYHAAVRFCPWYPLADAAVRAPAGEGVLQLRIADGLVDYPRGKSAMVRYVHAADARAAAVELAASGAPLLCRHLEIEAGASPAAIHARLHAEFVRRFGSPPRDEAAAR
jgi:hypothetical protein